VAGAGMWQVPDNPWWNGYPTNADGSWQEPEGESVTDPVPALPRGTETVQLSIGTVRIETRTGVAAVRAWAGPVADPRFAGHTELLEGRAPASASEILVSPATLDRADTSIGGTITLAESDDTATYTVTGTFWAAGARGDDSAIAFFDADRFESPTWYLPELALSWDDVQELNAQGVVAYSREVVLDPPTVTLPGGNTYVDAQTQQLYSMLALAAGLGAGGAAAGYMVVMLAGAAFAVSARRQQRALAIAASVGADARDLRRTVVLQGTVLGLIGGAVGVAAGVGLGALVLALTDDGSRTLFWGFHVPWVLLVAVLVFAALVGTLSALVPARGVARTDTISALRGARRPVTVTASRPVWGSVMVIVGAGITVLCGIAAAAIAVNHDIPWDSALRWLPFVGIVGGPILAQLGVILSGRWLLWLTSRVLSKIGIAARIASRDAVANGARTVPAFAAIGATVFVGMFAAGLGTMTAGQTARSWTYSAPVGHISAELYPMGEGGLTPEAREEGIVAAERLLDDVGAAEVGIVQRQPDYWNADLVPDGAVRAVALRPESALLDREGSWGWSGSNLNAPQNNISVIDADGVEAVTGVALTADQRAAYLDGDALVLEPEYVTGGTVELGAWMAEEWMYGGAPDNVYRPAPGDVDLVDPQWTRTLPAIVVSAPNQPAAVLLAPQTAEDLGLAVEASYAFGMFAEPPTTEDYDRLSELSQSIYTDEWGLSAWIESGPSSSEVWLIPLLIAVAVLVLGASAVALGLARFERRPDDATLSAVGGTNRLRRAIGFWQGLVIAGFGTFAGAVAGILPPIGFWLQSQTAPQGQMQLSDIPWAALAAVAVALPLLIAAANWLVPPRRPDLTRRTAIA